MITDPLEFDTAKYDAEIDRECIAFLRSRAPAIQRKISMNTQPETEARMNQIYLAGKVGGIKWDLAGNYLGSRPNITECFIASDGGNHSQHLWGYGYFDFSSLRDEVWRDSLCPLLESCCTIAVIDSPDAYGTIAELAYRSATGVAQMLLLIDDGFYADGDDASAELHYRLHDAYWFTSNLPGVRCIPVRRRDAQEAFNVLCDVFLRTGSPIEQKLLLALNDTFLMKCSIQHPIGKYRADFAFPSLHIAVECDGHDYHKTKEQRTHDAQRDRVFHSLGWTTLRFTGTEIHNSAGRCAHEVHSACVQKLEAERTTPVVAS